MVDPKRSSRSVKGSLHPLTAAALSALPPLGYKPPPTLIGFKTIDPSVIALRIKHYNRAYKTLSVNSWNTYVSFGIQDFVGPDEYYTHKEKESTEETHLRLARYYRNHLEHHAKIDGFLLQTISAVETALAQSHPGFFDMSLKDMDSYLRNCKTSSEDKANPMDIDIDNSATTEISSLLTAAKSNSTTVSTILPLVPPPLSDRSSLSSVDDGVLLCTQADPSIVTDQPINKLSTPAVDEDGTPSQPAAKPHQSAAPFHPLRQAKHSKLIKHSVRIETRWAPKDFHELRLSTEKMYRRLAPILSCFNNEHSWMLEWQTDQMDVMPDIDPTQLSKYLSIRVVPVVKEKCFYFSFRINASGAQFSQVMKSKILLAAKRGETLTFDPSSVPASQGELTYIGDILLKDASVTHRGQYLQFLRKEVLPSDTPVFDVKLRHSNPTGSRITILTVRCGKSMSTTLAETLSTALCGEGIHPEIFISRLALGANQTSKLDHERIYKVHNEYLEDASHLLFSASAAIDTETTEFFDSGETIRRTPRQWAKSLVSPDGQSLEADLENGGALESKAVLVVPSASLNLVKAELLHYWARRNPTLTHATKLYKESVASHPDIPKTVFTKNIDTILAKRIQKRQDAPTVDDSSTIFSPVSSLTGGGATGTTLSKGSIAWRKPLQDTLLSKQSARQNAPLLSVEINQQKRIEILEAQLSLQPGTTSQASLTSTKSVKSKTSRSSAPSGLSAESAHSRLDKVESSLEEIKNMFKAIMIRTSSPPPPTTTESINSTPDTPWRKQASENLLHEGQNMQGIQLFPPENTQGSTTLTLLGTPQRANPLKRRAASTPPKSPTTSTLSLQYNETTGSWGGDQC